MYSISGCWICFEISWTSRLIVLWRSTPQACTSAVMARSHSSFASTISPMTSKVCNWQANDSILVIFFLFFEPENQSSLIHPAFRPSLFLVSSSNRTCVGLVNALTKFEIAKSVIVCFALARPFFKPWNAFKMHCSSIMSIPLPNSLSRAADKSSFCWYFVASKARKIKLTVLASAVKHSRSHPGSTVALAFCTSATESRSSTGPKFLNTCFFRSKVGMSRLQIWNTIKRLLLHHYELFLDRFDGDPHSSNISNLTESSDRVNSKGVKVTDYCTRDIC